MATAGIATYSFTVTDYLASWLDSLNSWTITINFNKDSYTIIEQINEQGWLGLLTIFRVFYGDSLLYELPTSYEYKIH